MTYIVFESLRNISTGSMFAPTLVMAVLTLWFLLTVYEYEQREYTSTEVAMGIAGFYWIGVAVTVWMVLV